MLFETDQPARGRGKSRGILGASIAAHLGVLTVVLLVRPDAVRLTASPIALGDSARSYRVIYAPAGGTEIPPTDVQKFTAPQRHPRQRFHSRPNTFDPTPVVDAEIGDKSTHAGSPLGTTITGLVEGHEVKLAFPLVFPDPPIERSEVPKGLQGDVVIEVTIDSHGDVVQMRLLQSIGHGIDEKILSTLRTWRFTPATLDGVPVASKHDVHFHFPS